MESGCDGDGNGCVGQRQRQRRKQQRQEGNTKGQQAASTMITTDATPPINPTTQATPSNTQQQQQRTQRHEPDDQSHLLLSAGRTNPQASLMCILFACQMCVSNHLPQAQNEDIPYSRYKTRRGRKSQPRRQETPCVVWCRCRRNFGGNTTKTVTRLRPPFQKKKNSAS